MLKIPATQDHEYQDAGYVTTTSVVGYFPVNESLPPFCPQRVELVEGDLERSPNARFAWVAHDGNGRVAGFSIHPYWKSECANPEWELNPSNPKGFDYDLPEDCESSISV